MKIGVYGSAAGILSDVARGKAQAVGREIAKRGHILVTGASKGFPQEAVLGAYNEGGTCIGFSAATNLDDHVAEGFPTKGFKQLIYVPKTYEHAKSLLLSKKYRNISSVAFVDAGIIVGGRTGTLNEFTLLFDFGKKIGVLDQTGGITTRVLRTIVEDTDKKTNARVIFESDPAELVRKIDALQR